MGTDDGILNHMCHYLIRKKKNLISGPLKSQTSVRG